ncbi:unnamed protein product [Strongylus vulgaris]|uniref:Uncharacterized protein n=1 Tax=Strongylus vulgaris TaxID=40348 RepID=A0A3P7LGN1_STRVU|nr:unnamed protein product [Strongylus vulgaris]
MASDALQPLMADRSLSTSTSGPNDEEGSSTELAQATESPPSPTNFATLVNCNGLVCSNDTAPSDPEDKRVRPAVIDRLHLDLVQMPDSTPNGWLGSEEERRSRTEMWVESTSPGYASDEEKIESTAAALEGSEDSMEVPEVGKGL